MSDHSKLTPEIFNAQADALARLAQAFPAAVKDGEVDFTALREELGQFEEVGAERYELTWAGKQAAKKMAQTDAAGRTLEFVPEDSKDADTTQNLYIEGDNLEVLKLLRQNYYGAVKMIYIDPPYNTGNDFVYRDNFNGNKTESDEAEGETEDGERMVVNQKSTNRYHANWLNMMLPRLRIAKDLLTDDGVIFISIDDNEIRNLRTLCDEIMGEESFVAQIIWQKVYSPRMDVEGFSASHDYILCYVKSSIESIRREAFQQNTAQFNFVDDKTGQKYRRRSVRKEGSHSTRSERPNLFFPLIAPDGSELYPMKPDGTEGCWRWSMNTYIENNNQGLVEWVETANGWQVYAKQFFDENAAKPPETLWLHNEVNHNHGAAEELKKIMGGKFFDSPKPKELIMKMLKIATDDDSIILDFFSGSATTAHAVMQLNAEDGGNRRFIMVQWPEETDVKSDANKAGYKNICAIGKERIRRAGDKIKAEIEKVNQQLTIDGEAKQMHDIGFRVFRTADTNIRWTHEAIKGQLDLAEAELSDQDRMDFMPGYTDIDVVYEVLLHQRDIPLSAKIEKLNIGNRTYLFADAYVVCLDETITPELIEALAAIEPTPIKYIIRDSAFGDDISLKDESMRRLEAYVSRNTGEQKAYTVEFI